MGTKRVVNVVVLRPDESVVSLGDERDAGLVAAAQEAATSAFGHLDVDDDVDVAEYLTDLRGALAKAEAIAVTTLNDRSCLFAIVTDFRTNDEAGVAERLGRLVKGGHFVVFVRIDLQPSDMQTRLAEWLREHPLFGRGVDVASNDGLRDPETALAKVGPWAASKAAV